jgi:hypothetical protein
MKKLIILIAIIPTLIFGQTQVKSSDSEWVNDLISYRESQNLPVVRDKSLDTLAKERFLAMFSLLQKHNIGFHKFVNDFGKGQHGIPELGLPSFNDYIAGKYQDGNYQEICSFISGIHSGNELAISKEVSDRGSIGGNYRKSSPHWEIASGKIKVNEIVKRYNGKTGKSERIEREVIVNNYKFGSYTGIFSYYDFKPDGSMVKVNLLVNVTIFQ